MNRSEPIVIVGLGGVFPSSPTLADFWSHVASGRDVAADAPAGRWALSPARAYDPRRPSPDRVYSTRACLVDDAALAGASVTDGLDIEADFAAKLDPMVRLALRAGRDAWFDAHMDGVDRARTGVILGNIALPTESNAQLADWILGRRFDRALFATTARPPAAINRFVIGLPAGMLAKALGLGGGHYALDAACASSLFALDLAAEELRAGRADAMLTGGLSRPDCLYTQMGFSQLTALSPTGRCSPFDHKGDGLVVGEGAGVFVLKRLSDALAHGDTIYALLRGTGTSNDVDGNLLAPSREGQLRAMRSAYREADWDPRSVELIECHATGTQVGDGVEFRSLLGLWGDDGFDAGQCTIGSVKSNVGHLLTGAGAAGLAKVLLAMRHGVLPPTANFEAPGAAISLDGSPFIVRSEATEWQSAGPRRAAVSGFGFGGTNAHVLLEEWSPAAKTSAAVPATLAASAAPEAGPAPAGGAEDDVVIVGMSATVGPWDGLLAFQHRVLGGGPDVAAEAKRGYWGLDDAPRGFFIDELDLPIGEFRIPPKELEETLPQQLLMLQVTKRALADAETSTIDRLRTGVFIGIGLDLNTTNYHLRWVLEERAKERRADRSNGAANSEGAPEAFEAWLSEEAGRLTAPLNANRVMGNLGGIVASRVAREFSLGGPSYVLSSEEGAGFSALEAAVRGLARGQVDCAVVGAIDLSGDPRQAAAMDAQKPMSRGEAVRPFDQAADGTLPAEGAVALVLKRRGDAVAQGDRIYAVVRGLASATGGAADAVVPTEGAYRRALEDAYAEAEVDPGTVAFVEAHGSGHPGEDRVEAAAVGAWFRGDRRTVVSSAKADVGHAGAAAPLVSVARATLALHHRTLPPLRTVERPRRALAHVAMPRAPQYWLHDTDGPPRRAAVSAMSSTGHVGHLILEEAPTPTAPVTPPVTSTDPHPLGPLPEALFTVEATTTAGLVRDLRALDALATDARAADARALEDLGTRWWHGHGARPDAPLGLALVARSSDEVCRLVAEAIGHLEGDGALHSRRIFFSKDPLGADAEVAFVYPGSGNHYPGMGQALAAHFPGVLRAQEGESAGLYSQLVPDLIWNQRADGRDGVDGRGIPADARRLILAQVTLGTVVSDLVRSFGVEPRAVVGYSLGETAGMFSLGAWRDRDEMLRRVNASPLFTTELTGPCAAAKRAWGLSPEEGVEWLLGVVDRPAEVVRERIAHVDRAYLQIVNTPDECVVGGEAGAVRRLVEELGCTLHELHGVTTVHCEVAREVEDAYRELHLLETNAPANVRFYSGARGEAFPVSRERAAQSIVDNAIDGVDWPKTIEAAYADGARVFLEMGPGASCTRMIQKILAGRRFVARSVCAQGQDGVSSVLRTLGALVAERVPVTRDALYPAPAPTAELDRRTPPSIVVPVGRGPLAPMRPFAAEEAGSAAPPGEPAQRAQVGRGARPQTAPMNGGASHRGHGETAPPTTGTPSTAARLLLASEAAADAHEAYLRLSDRVTSIVTEQLTRAPELLRAAPRGLALRGDPGVSQGAPVGPAGAPRSSTRALASAPPGAAVHRAPPAEVALDRAACLEFATGSIAAVLGSEFASIDAHPTRVRLPDEPLMLVDRILRIEGEARSMSRGKVVTEHDVLEDAWYLDNGRIPTCVAVEAGQADLFLSAYLGIDFITRGLAVYRLLDAVVTFHGALPGVDDVIHYDIDILEFFRHGDTWLFRFEFEATVDGRALMTMRDGCAGFFSQAELDAGQGIVHSRLERQWHRRPLPADWRTLAPMTKCRLGAAEVEALIAGDLGAAFGPLFEGLPVEAPLTIPGGPMQLVHRVDEIDPDGGRYGLGFIRAHADIHPDDWFLTCHFVDDKVMPGTLMYECCLHTLRIYLLRLGWVAEAAHVVAQPIEGIGSRLKCRGQVLDTTKLVTYEVSIKDLGYDPEPFAVVDALMYADGKPIVEISEMSLRLTGASRAELEALWHDAPEPRPEPGVPATFAPAVYGYDRILAFSSGKPSDAFGAPYRVFDEGRKIARLPRPPFQFLDRIVAVSGAPFVMEAGATCEAQVEVTSDQWYFRANRQGQIPFAVLLEMALQPCGWLAGYVGSALTSTDDVKFRNLGGHGVQHRPVWAEQDVLTTRVELTGVSSSGGMIIQHFSFDLRSERYGAVYTGTTYFGFFSNAALADQVGIRDAEHYAVTAEERARAVSFPVPEAAPFPDDTMRMVTDVDLYVADGGPQGLGYLEGSIDVRSDFWFFEAHFFEDPVWPGSLGLEAFLQAMKVVARDRWSLGPEARFATMPEGARHEWVYRGQVIPTDGRVTVRVAIKAVDDDKHRLVADGFLCVDGRTIYQMIDFALETTP